jgi:hypothetical protein
MLTTQTPWAEAGIHPPSTRTVLNAMRPDASQRAVGGIFATSKLRPSLGRSVKGSPSRISIREGPTPLAASDQSRRPEAPCLIKVMRLLFPAGSDAAASNKVAFTLQVVFADLIYSLFPAMAHRVAVISPQAAEIFSKLSNHRSELERNIGNRYPRFAALINEKVGIGDVDGPGMTRLLDPLVLKKFGEAERPPVAGKGEETIDIYLIEDWPSDLGVCNALCAREFDVRRMLVDYLDWLERNKDREDLYHRFGSDRLLDVFAYAEAAALLRRAG